MHFSLPIKIVDQQSEKKETDAIFEDAWKQAEERQSLK